MFAATAVQHAGENAHLLLYDGVCGLCDRLVQFVLKRDTRAIFHFAALQSAAARAALQPFSSNPDDLSTFYVVANYQAPAPVLLTKGRAAIFVLTTIGGPWRVARLLSVLPTSLLSRLYDLIAQNRYRVFGRRDQCLIPQPRYRSRFIDAAEGAQSETIR
jgi:predicted DCC family thiol-disulfide oxidoreductase YuxK